MLGDGSRFAALKSKLQSHGKSAENASAIAAIAGRKKYGAAKMNSMAQRAKVRKKMGYK